MPDTAWTPLTRPAPYTVAPPPRQRPVNVKAVVIRGRGFRNLRLQGEAVAEFAYNVSPQGTGLFWG